MKKETQNSTAADLAHSAEGLRINFTSKWGEKHNFVVDKADVQPSGSVKLSTAAPLTQGGDCVVIPGSHFPILVKSGYVKMFYPALNGVTWSVAMLVGKDEKRKEALS